jgi:hypothetical protein
VILLLLWSRLAQSVHAPDIAVCLLMADSVEKVGGCDA